jgi:uncharacterized protein (DUF433 family)
MARIADRRITVHNVVIWYERMGLSADEIAADHSLALSDVYSALAYYHDHRAEIDQVIEEDRAFVEELRRITPSNLPEKLCARED